MADQGIPGNSKASPDTDSTTNQKPKMRRTEQGLPKLYLCKNPQHIHDWASDTDCLNEEFDASGQMTFSQALEKVVKEFHL